MRIVKNGLAPNTHDVYSQMPSAYHDWLGHLAAVILIAKALNLKLAPWTKPRTDFG